jgi:hypothetical protein
MTFCYDLLLQSLQKQVEMGSSWPDVKQPDHELKKI